MTQPSLMPDRPPKVQPRDTRPLRERLGGPAALYGNKGGYVCDDCGWWVPDLSARAPHCEHRRFKLPEQMTYEEVRMAKWKAANG